VHLLDANGRVIGQKDTPPLNGDAPTDSWVANEYIADTFSIDISANAPRGPAVVEIGFYDPVSGQRLPVSEASVAGRGDHVLIEGLTIGP
jgi:hypothetical protein